MLSLLTYLRPYRRGVVLCVMFNVLTVLFSTVSISMLLPFFNILFDQQKPVDAPPAALQFSLNSVLAHLNFAFSELIRTEGKQAALFVVCVVIVVMFFFKNLTRYLALFVISPVRTGIERDIREAIFSKVLRLPLAYYTEQRKGDLIARMTADVQEVQWSILNVIEIVVREPLMILITLFALVYISPVMTLFVFILLGFTGLAIGGVGKSLRKKSAEAQSQLGVLISRMDETLGGLRIIKGFNADRHQEGVFAEENTDYRNMLVRILRRRDAASPLSEFLGVTVFVILLYFGAQIVFSGHLLATTFIVYLGLFYQIIDPAKSFSSSTFNIRKGLAAKDRIDEILMAQESISDPKKPISLAGLTDNITFKNVCFQYNDDRLILDNINLVIPKGKNIALIGASGAGKSTLVDLLPRFYDPTRGEVLIDGINIKDVRLSDLRSLLGIVSQEAILFNDTIYDNIVFGQENCTVEQVEAAARAANAHEFILNTEHGYQTRIGDRGTKLSGGQRQRITIARALLKNPSILILDEATSALDGESERLVQDALVKLMQNRTAIVIAHRLSTIQHADEIIVLNEGRIVERGTHQTLLAQSGTYKRLVELQGKLTEK